MDDLGARTAAKKAELDRLRPVVGAGLDNLEHIHDLELTYTSNAIEGNTLNAAETTLVIEQGITIGGKPLKDHLEVIDHYEAIRYVRELARQGSPLTEADLRQLHHLVVQRSHPEIAGRYADQGRYVLTETGRHTFPSANGSACPDGAISSAGSVARPIRPRPPSRRTGGSLTSIRSTTATAAPRGS